METTTVKLVSVYNGFLQLRVSLPRRLSLLMPKVFPAQGSTLNFHEFFTQKLKKYKTTTFSKKNPKNISREIKVVNSWKLQNPNIFTIFFNQIFFDNFSVKSKLSMTKKCKTATCSRVFHPKFFVSILRSNLVSMKLDLVMPNAKSDFYNYGGAQTVKKGFIVTWSKSPIYLVFFVIVDLCYTSQEILLVITEDLTKLSLSHHLW